MDRPTSRKGGSSAHRNPDVKGQVISLDAWKSRKRQQNRRETRKKQRRDGDTLRVSALVVVGAEMVAVISSWIPSPYQMHSIVIAWILGIFGCVSGLWLNVRMNKAAGKILAWSGIGLLLSLVPGWFPTPV